MNGDGRKKWGKDHVGLPSAIMMASALMMMLGHMAWAGTMLTHEAFKPTGQQALRVESDHYVAVVVPESGGRILSLVDATTSAELVHINLHNGVSDWGGLLDDKRNRTNKPYELKIIRDTGTEAEISLAWQDEETGQGLVKTLVFHRHQPIIDVTYTYINASQEAMYEDETGVKNGLLPGGADISTEDVYSIPTTSAVRHYSPAADRQWVADHPMPEWGQKFKRQVGAPWHAFLNQRKKMGLAFIHQDDGYAAWYMWKERIPRPTYEWVFRSVPAGQQATYRMRIVLTHGFELLTDANARYLLAVMPGEASPDTVTINMQALAIEQAIDDCIIQLHVETLQGRKVLSLPDVHWGRLPMDGPARQQVSFDLPAKGHYLLKGRVMSGQAQIGQFEDVLSFHAGHYVQGNHSRQPAWPAEAARQAVKDWRPENQPLLARPTQADRDRGFMVFGLTGPQAGEHLKRMELAAAAGEYESFSVAYEPLTNQSGQVSWGVSSLREAASGAVVGDGPEVFIEQVESFDMLNTYGVARPVNLHRLDPLTRFDGSQRRTLWCKVSTHGLSPGSYTFDLHIVPDWGREVVIPVTLRVADVQMPDKLVSLEAEGYLEAFGDPRLHGRRMGNYMADLAAHQADFLQLGADYGRNPSWYSQPVLRDGRAWKEVIRQQSDASYESIESCQLDFTAYNAWVYPAIEHGLTQFKTSYYDIRPPSPYGKLALRELAWYLRERGYPASGLWIKNLDEQPPENFQAMQSVARELKGLGWRVFTTVNHLWEYPDQLAVLAPEFDMFQARSAEPQTIAARCREGLLTPRHQVWTYTGSGTSARTYERMLSFGWYAAWLGLDGFHNHEYMRGGGKRIPNSIVFPTPNGPITSPAWEGLRDGMDVANLYRQAQRIILAARRDGLVSQELAGDWERVLEEIISPASSSIIPVGRMQISPSQSISSIAHLSRDQHARARVKLLDLLEQMNRQVGSRLAHDILWGEVKIVRRSETVYAIKLSQGIKPETLQPLRAKVGRFAGSEADHPVIHVGTLADAELVKLIREAGLATRYTASYPAAGDYAVIALADAAGASPRIILLGGDEAGCELAVRMFTRFLSRRVALDPIASDKE